MLAVPSIYPQFVRTLMDGQYATSRIVQCGSDATHFSLNVQTETIRASRTFGLKEIYPFDSGAWSCLRERHPPRSPHFSGIVPVHRTVRI